MNKTTVKKPDFSIFLGNKESLNVNIGPSHLETGM